MHLQIGHQLQHHNHDLNHDEFLVVHLGQMNEDEEVSCELSKNSKQPIQLRELSPVKKINIFITMTQELINDSKFAIYSISKWYYKPNYSFTTYLNNKRVLVGLILFGTWWSQSSKLVLNCRLVLQPRLKTHFKFVKIIQKYVYLFLE